MGYSYAYNGGSSPSGTTKFAKLQIGGNNREYTNYGSLNWYASAPYDGKFLIVSDTYSQGWSTEGNSTPTFWRSTENTLDSLKDLVNQLPDVNGVTGFTTATDAINYINSTDKYLISQESDSYDEGEIPLSGLVFNLNAGYSNSIPKSGDTWFDLNNNNNFNLINGALYSDFNGGCIYLDGTDDYIISDKNSGILGNSPRTVAGWYYLQFSSGGGHGSWGNLFTTGNGDCSRKMFGLALQSGKLMTWGGCYDASTNISLPTNSWLFIAASYDGANYDAYVNETTVRLSLPSYNTTESKIFLGAETTNNGSSFRGRMKGYLGSFYQYNRFLSSSEISQLYNATKGRFGL